MHATIRQIVAVCTFSMMLATLGGCNGPSKAGLEARAAANDRMNIINAQVQYDQARQSFDSGQFERALREVRRSIARFPESPVYYILQGRINLETHQLEAALESFKMAIDVGEERLAALSPAGNKGADADSAKPIDPTAPRVRLNEDGSPTRRTEQGVTLSPLQVAIAEAHYFSGIVYQRWSEDELAHGSYMKAFEIDSTNAQYLLAAAESLISLGEFDAASELITPRMWFFEHNAALRQLQGQIALLKGDARAAVSLYSQARLLNPDDSGLLEQLMWAQYAAGMYGECMEAIKTLQNILASSAKKNTTKSISALRLTPVTESSLLHMKARCLKMMGRMPEARELYVQLTRLSPSDPIIWIELATLAWDLGDYRRMAQCSVQIIALAPERYEGYMYKALNERDRGNLQEAVKLFEQSVEVALLTGTEMALPHLLLGNTLEQTGDLASARACYEQALQIQPDSSEAQELLRRLNDRAGEVSLSAAPVE